MSRLRSPARRPLALVFAALTLLGFAACGDDGGGSDGAGGAAGAPGGAAGTAGTGGAAAAGGDSGGTDGDASLDGSGATGQDAGADADGAADAGPTLCLCDVTVLCDTGCACDIACSVVPGKPPLGADAVLLGRAEVAIYYPNLAAGPIDRVTLRDDGYAGSGGPTPPHASLLPATSRPALAMRPVTLAADVDDDGREEVILVGPSSVIVEDWNGTSLSPRTVHSYALASRFDAAAGDLDGDGGRDLVVARQTGTTLTLEVLAIPPTGTATVRASHSLTGVGRHALAVGAPKKGETPEIHVLVAGTGSPGSLEKLHVRRFSLAGSTLTEQAAVDLGGECLVEQSPPDEGAAIAVGNLDADPESELVYAIYCEPTSLYVKEYDPGLGYQRQWVNPPPLDADTYEQAAFRPFVAIGSLGTKTLDTPMIAVGTSVKGGSFNARGPAALVTILRRQLSQLTKYTSLELGPSGQHAILTALALRDVDRDGIDEVVTAATKVELVDNGFGTCDLTDFYCSPRAYGVLVQKHEPTLSGTPVTLLDQNLSELDGLGPGATVAVGDFDADSVRVRATGQVFLHTGEPHVNAVLAAPPTWMGIAGVAHADGAETSFGFTSTSGTSESKNISASAAVTVSAEVPFEVVEFSASVTASFEYSTSTTFAQTLSYGKQTSVGPDADLVVFRTIPYASHEYEVLSHPNPVEIGSKITIDVPGTMIETVRTLEDFRTEYGALADQVIPPTLLTHKIGDPSTYPDPTSCTQAVIASRVKTGSVSKAYGSPTLVDVGKASSGANTQSIGMGTQTSSTTEFNLSVEMSVGVGAGGVSLETSVGMGVGWSHETSIGKDVEYAGAVGFLSQGYDVNTRFQWGLCVFHWADDPSSPSKGAYPVVDYVVKKY